jgi:hypothetical protein
MIHCFHHGQALVATVWPRCGHQHTYALFMSPCRVLVTWTSTCLHTYISIFFTWVLLTLKHKKETVKLLCLLLMAANMQQPSLWYRQRSYWPPDLQSSALPTELNPLVTVTRADICLVISITAAVHLQWHANAFCHRLPPWTPIMATRCIVIWCLHLPACACIAFTLAFILAFTLAFTACISF